MDPQAQLDALIDLAEAVGIAVRRVATGGADAHSGGALVRLKGREVIFLDAMAATADQLDVVAAALHGRAELEDQFLPPQLRERIDAAGGRG